MIIFTSLEYKNFLSTGNSPTKIILNKSPTTVITGKSGDGKSTILDALFFGLFGKPFRNINKPLLINSVNNSNLEVVLEFTVKNKNYKIIRGIKPSVFEIYENGILIPQDASVRDYQINLEQNIMNGINENVFRQVVVVGSANHTSFMALPASRKREVIEELLDIKIFSHMTEILKNRQNTIKEKLKETEYEIDILSEKIKLHKSFQEKSEIQSKNFKKEIQESIDKEKKTIQENNNKISKLKCQKDSENSGIKNKTKVKNIIKNIEQLKSEIQIKKNNIEKDIEFFKHSENCPTCKQSIQENFKNEILNFNQKEQKKLIEALEKLGSKNTVHLNELEEIKKVENRINEIEKEIQSIESEINSSYKYIKRMLQDTNNHTENPETKIDIEEYNKKLSELKRTLENQKDIFDYNESVMWLLKDKGIKTQIINQYLPLMNRLINEHLNKLGLSIQFTLDENFEEVIKSRFRDFFSYNNFSEGEKARIDMAILLTWRLIAKRKNTANCNLLILDEVFDGNLDSTSADDLLNLLLEQTEKNNIFIITHKADMVDKTHSHIHFEKINNFSRIQ